MAKYVDCAGLIYTQRPAHRDGHSLFKNGTYASTARQGIILLNPLSVLHAVDKGDSAETRVSMNHHWQVLRLKDAQNLHSRRKYAVSLAKGSTSSYAIELLGYQRIRILDV